MRILLASSAAHVPPRGGATRSNLVWLRHLAAHGHECRVVGGTENDTPAPDVVRDDIRFFSLSEPALRSAFLRNQIETWKPDWALISSEDLSHALLREAFRSAPTQVVYLAHTPQFFPFGPESWNRDPDASRLLEGAAAIIAISRSVADYVTQHLGREPRVIHPPIYGSGPWPDLGNVTAGAVTMINPSAVKGISIFLALADRFPQITFHALHGWGTTLADEAAIAERPNITVIGSVPDIEQELARTRVLLMPSLWYEGFGLIVMEAMLRGIPVIASDAGGLVEAKLGTDFVIPVNRIERFKEGYDERHMPLAAAPLQNIDAWEQALRDLLEDSDLYRRQSRESREAALRFVTSLDAAEFERMLRGLSRKTMRILLAHNSTYYPAHGGGDTSNRLLLEALVARGHECAVVSRTASHGPQARHDLLAGLAHRDVTATLEEPGVVRFTLNGVEVLTATDTPNLRDYFTRQIAAFQPDVILASTDDSAQVLLQAALESRVPVIYLARATIALPFGPDCAFPSTAKTEALRQAHGVVGVSRYVADYIRRWGGIEAVALPISFMGSGPFANLGHVDNEFVTLVNPCVVKGIDIFVALADTMPDLRFAAVPTWGTGEADFAKLRLRANITVLHPVDNIDRILERTRVLIVPSVWAEARSRIVMEAMLRGIPVIASNTGGLPEAKLGVPYVLAVAAIPHYEARVDAQMVPVAETPPQDLQPWIEAVTRLTSDSDHWREIAAASREAAHRYFNEELRIEPFEQLLVNTVAGTRRQKAAAPALLSAEKRRLLALKLREQWLLPTELRPDALNLICFPYAGASAVPFRSWRDRLHPLTARYSAHVDSMQGIVEGLLRHAGPKLRGRFAFFGHSMGAGIAFEFTRELRRHQMPLPVALLVSSASAPQLRTEIAPDPSEEELLAALVHMHGGVIDPETLRPLLPRFSADSRLYRRYLYKPDAPLDVPIRVYGGADDILPSLEAWREQTTRSFGLRLFAGGHLYLNESTDQLLDAITDDLNEIPQG